MKYSSTWITEREQTTKTDEIKRSAEIFMKLTRIDRHLKKSRGTTVERCDNNSKNMVVNRNVNKNETQLSILD